jgi:REP element-mobilizing transposase RayT
VQVRVAEPGWRDDPNVERRQTLIESGPECSDYEPRVHQRLPRPVKQSRGQTIVLRETGYPHQFRWRLSPVRSSKPTSRTPRLDCGNWLGFQALQSVYFSRLPATVPTGLLVLTLDAPLFSRRGGRQSRILVLFKLPMARQLSLALPKWGGRRKGAGRKPVHSRPGLIRPGVPHLRRSALKARHPLHVTLRLLKGVPSLRRSDVRRALESAFHAARDRFGFRLIHYSIQGNHLHLLVEAEDATALSRGMQGLAIRCARAINRVLRRRGKVFADRFHSHALRAPREVARPVHVAALAVASARRRRAGPGAAHLAATRRVAPLVGHSRCLNRPICRTNSSASTRCWRAAAVTFTAPDGGSGRRRRAPAAPGRWRPSRGRRR